MVTQALDGRLVEMKGDLSVSERAHNRESIMQAIAAIKQNREHGTKLSVRNAATKYGVSKSTLHRYLARDERTLPDAEGFAHGNTPAVIVLVDVEKETKAAPSKPRRKAVLSEMTGGKAMLVSRKSNGEKKSKSAPTDSPADKKKEESGSKKKEDGTGIATLLAASEVAVRPGQKKEQKGAKRQRAQEETDDTADLEKSSKASRHEEKVTPEYPKLTQIRDLQKDLDELQTAVSRLQSRVQGLESRRKEISKPSDLKS
ncbi:hypothetical protein NDN08_005190 [Rhodosorus marinus]|uniref:HTH psq-type domain-containing protein n=1 Tax=Rhodosorus marinus TaxID=101924 RepID=A0AAV8V0X8_9RHOD|nr:hypothetical protein NDN08_005190 [Rhodosorus marinus]